MNKNLRAMGSMALLSLFIVAGCAVPVEKKSEKPAEPEVQAENELSDQRGRREERHRTGKLDIETVKNATDFNVAVLTATKLAREKDLPAVIIAVGPMIDEEHNEMLMTALNRIVERREVKDRVIVVAKAAKDAEADTFKSHFVADLGEGDLSVMAKVSPVEGEPFEVVGLINVLELLEKGLETAAESQKVISCHCPTGKGDATAQDDGKCTCPKPKGEEEADKEADKKEEDASIEKKIDSGTEEGKEEDQSREEGSSDDSDQQSKGTGSHCDPSDPNCPDKDRD